MILSASVSQQASGVGWLLIGGIAFLAFFATPRVQKAPKTKPAATGKPSTGMWVLWLFLGAIVVGAGAKGKADLTSPSTPSRPPAVVVPHKSAPAPAKPHTHKPTGSASCKPGALICLHN